MTELIDVSKWFRGNVIINPDFVVRIQSDHTGYDEDIKGNREYLYGFKVFTMGGLSFISKDYADKKTAEYEMEQFCKKIQGEI